MTLEQQAHQQEVKIRKQQDEIEQLKNNIQKLIEFLNSTNCHISNTGDLITKGYYNC